MNREMKHALQLDGEKLRQLTGEDHGPWWPDESLPCNWEHMSGECLYCGAQIGEQCGWDGNRGRKE